MDQVDIAVIVSHASQNCFLETVRLDESHTRPLIPNVSKIYRSSGWIPVNTARLAQYSIVVVQDDYSEDDLDFRLK